MKIEESFEENNQGEDLICVNLSKESTVLNCHIALVIDYYVQELVRSKEKITPIHVDEIASGLARFYEKIRKVIDWKDDNALRRGAIERILKRSLFPKMVGFSLKNHDSKVLGKTLTTELIRGGHLLNHTIPQERIEIVSNALFKYLYFLEYIFNKYHSLEVKAKTNVATFVLEIAACEIEEILINPVKEQGIVNAMANILNERVSVFPDNSLTPERKLELVKISSQRKLYHLDDKYISFQLLKTKYPNWKNLSKEEMQEVAKNLLEIQKKLHKYMNGRVNGKFDEIAEQIDTIFLLFDDVLEGLKDEPGNIKGILENKEKFSSLVTEAYEKRNKTLKRRLINLAIFSTLSVFLCNWVAFYIIEVPLANLFYGGFSALAIAVDLFLPTLVVFLLVAFIKPPREGNLKKVLSTSLSFIYTDEGSENYEINLKNKKDTPFYTFMTFLYIITAIGVFGGIAYIFHIAKLPITSVIYNTLTIPIAVFAAVVVRKQAKELNVGEDANLQDFFLDVLTVPVAKVGSILARKWREYNVVAVFFNLLIEIPLIALFDFIQGWNEYIKEKKSEIS